MTVTPRRRRDRRRRAPRARRRPTRCATAATCWCSNGRRSATRVADRTGRHASSGSGTPTARTSRWRSAAAEMLARARADAGVQLLHPTPQLTFGPGADAVYDALDGGRRARWNASVRPRSRSGFPRSPAAATRCWRPDSAVIAADRTLADAARPLRRRGARARARRRVDAHHVETTTGTIEARAVVVCAGPVDAFAGAGDPDHGDARARRLRPRAAPGLPIFIDFTEPAVYGLPTPGFGSLQDRGAPRRPRDRSRTRVRARPRGGRRVASARSRGGCPGADSCEVDVCPYDNTPDERLRRRSDRRDRRRRRDLRPRVQVRPAPRRAAGRGSCCNPADRFARGPDQIAPEPRTRRPGRSPVSPSCDRVCTPATSVAR